jgi:hypothetical protein
MHSQSFKYAHQTATSTVSICNAQTWLNQYHMHSIATTLIHLRAILIHQLDNPYIVNHSSMHIKQQQRLSASAMHKHAYIQYHMYSIASTHIHLLTILIHQVDISSIANHSSMHIKQPQVLSASAMQKLCQNTISHAFNRLNSYSLTDYPYSSIRQPMNSQSFKYAHQTATNTVSIFIAQTCLHTISHAFQNITCIP